MLLHQRKLQSALNRRQSATSQTAFTFTEILIVLAIIAGVTVIVLAQAGTAVTSGTLQQMSTDMNSIVAAVRAARSFNPDLDTILDFTYLRDNNLLPEHLIPHVGSGITKYQLRNAANPFGGIYIVAKGPSGSFVVGAGLAVVTDTDERQEIFARLDAIYDPEYKCKTVNFTAPGCATGYTWLATDTFWGTTFR